MNINVRVRQVLCVSFCVCVGVCVGESIILKKCGLAALLLRLFFFEKNYTTEDIFLTQHAAHKHDDPSVLGVLLVGWVCVGGGGLLGEKETVCFHT